MTLIPYAVRRHRASAATSVAKVAPTCFACAGVLSIGPPRARGFCAECWERSRVPVVDAELGGEA
jgi:hypothetical protein